MSVGAAIAVGAVSQKAIVSYIRRPHLVVGRGPIEPALFVLDVPIKRCERRIDELCHLAIKSGRARRQAKPRPESDNAS